MVVSVYGAVSETVTITNGTDTYTVATNANGVGTTTPEVKLGIYTVTGTVSAGALPSGRSVTVDKNTTAITAYPDGLIYWYGRFATGANAVGVNLAGGAAITKGTNSLSGQGAYQYYMHVYFTPTVSLAGKTLRMAINSSYGSDSYRCFGLRNTTGGLSGATDGYVAVGTPATSGVSALAIPANLTGNQYITWSCYSGGVTIGAVWYDDEPVIPTGEQLAGTNSVDVLSGTYRYGNTCVSEWGTAGSYSTDNYVGNKSTETNSALIPVGSFSFSGASKRLILSFYGYCPSINFATKGFRWAICTGDANKALYEGTGAVTGDGTQLASGIGTLAYNNGSYTTYNIALPATNLPTGTPLYVYLWPNGTLTDVSHFRGTLTAKLYYEV